ncbi:beta strand repeat-containing protein [Lactococcus protaetiae]|uniref:Uncharacterized protein n=1 Tax=Lactococcus protaetiae TaxID=2592653 RepID=A0A514Z9C1_9LACT|nr:hypothetical protein [Lactococcus protaetiae]QDK71189.1 hypothetical protein FLP15_08505 [Lactococcus protaetiae]
MSGKDANGNTVTGTTVTYSGQQDPNGTTYTGDYAEISNGKGTTLTPVVAGKIVANDSKGNPIQLSGITVTGGKETGITCTITYSEDASKNMTIVWDGAATTITEPVINQTSTDSSGTNAISATGTPNKSGSFYSNFANDQEVISIGPNLTTASKGILTLTPASGNQIGAAELTSYKLDMTKTWNFGGQVAIGGTGGADGVGFALYPGNVGQIGKKGLDLGVGGLSGAFGWTADTYANGAGATTDPAYLLQGSDSTSTGTNGTYKGSDGPSNYTLPTSGATVSNSGTNTTTQNLALNFTTGGGTNTARGGWAFSRPSGGSATNAYSVFDLTDCPTADISGFLDNSFHDFTLQYTPGTKSTKASDLAQGTIAVEYGADLTSASAPSVTTSGNATTSGTTTILPNGSTWAIQGNGNSTNAVAFSSESSASSNSNYKITIANNMAASTTPTATYGSALTGMKLALKSFSYKGTPYPIGTTFSYTQQGTSSSFTSGYGTVSYSTPTITYSNVIVAKSSTTTSTSTSVTYYYASFATYSANSVDGSSDFKWSIPVAELEYNAGGASEVGITKMSFAFLGSTGGAMNLQQVEFQGDATANAMQSNQGFGFSPSPGYVTVGYVDFTKNTVVNLSGQQLVNNAGNPISQIKSKNASGVDVSPPTAKSVTTMITPDGKNQNNIGNEFTDQVSRMYQTLAPDVGGSGGGFDPGDGTAVPSEIFNKSTTPFSPTNPFSVSPDYTYAGIYGTALGSITSLSGDSSGNIYINGSTTAAVNLDTTAGSYDGTSMSGKYTGTFSANDTYLYYIYKPATEYANVTYVDLNGGSDGKTPTYVDPSITGANKDTSTQISIAYKGTVGATLSAVSYAASNYTNAKTTGTNLVTANASSNFAIPAGYQLSYAINTTGQSGAGTNKIMTGSSPSDSSTPTIPNSSGTNAATDVSTSGLTFDWSLAENTPETITIYLTHIAASSINGTALTPILQAETINYYTNTGSATVPAGTTTVATAVTNYIGFSNVYDQVNGNLLYTDWYNYGTSKPTLTASSAPALNNDGSLASSATGWSTYNSSSPPQFLSSSFPTVSGKYINAVTNAGVVVTPVPTQVPAVTATGGTQFAGYTTSSSYPTTNSYTPTISSITLNVYYNTSTSIAMSNSPTYTTEHVNYVAQTDPTHQVATTSQQTITFITVNAMSGTSGSGTTTGVYATYWYDGIPTTYPTVSYTSSNTVGTVSAPTGWTLLSTDPSFDSITNIAGKIAAPHSPSMIL